MKRIALGLSLVLAAPLLAQPFVYREPELNAPPSVSRMFVRSVDAKSVSQGVDLPATGGGGMIILLLPVTNGGGRTTATLRTPTGDALATTERAPSSGNLRRFTVDAAETLGIRAGSDQDVLHVDRTEAARYRLTDIALPEGSAGLLSAGLLVVAGEPDSRLTLTTTVGPLSRRQEDPVTLHATLRDDSTPITGAHVTARLAGPGASAGEAIALFDDGRHNDGAANDGDYAAVVTDLPSGAAGFWSVRYDAEGTSAQDVAFARSSSNEFMNERLSARLNARSIRATVVDGMLRVTANADVLVAGRYRFDVIVASPRNANGERQGLATGDAEQTLPAGPAQFRVELPFTGASADDVFLDVRLLSLDTLGVAGRATILPVSERDPRGRTGL